MKKNTAQIVRARLRGLADAAMAEHAQRFFKTGKGQYGYGDKFLGIRVPVVRQQVKALGPMPLSEYSKLLHSGYHEERLFALLSMVRVFERSDEDARTAVYVVYLHYTAHINNWDLVDCSAPNIVGAYLADRDKRPLYALAASESLWERRIAMLATLTFIRRNQFDDALKIARLLRDDTEDLIHKAVGWMLREIGKRDRAAEKKFLDTHAAQMPRTMLRYAIEKFSDAQRRYYRDQ